MTLTKNHVIDSIYKNTDLIKSEAAQTFQSLMEIMKQTLESGEDVLISGFGKFCVKEKKERKGRNPATADDMIRSGVLRERLNGRKTKAKKRSTGNRWQYAIK